MSRRESTTRRGAPRRRDGGPNPVALREEVEIELVGILVPADGRPGWSDEDTVLLEGEEDLLALVESLRRGARARARRAPAPGPAARAVRYALAH